MWYLFILISVNNRLCRNGIKKTKCNQKFWNEKIESGFIKVFFDFPRSLLKDVKEFILQPCTYLVLYRMTTILTTLFITFLFPWPFAISQHQSMVGSR